MQIYWIALALGLLFSAPVIAKTERLYQITPDQVRPTQFTIGERAVARRTRSLLEKTPDELNEYLRTRPLRGVMGPGRQMYISDGHHLAAAAKRARLEHLFIEIQHDYSDLSVEMFWARMKHEDAVYLYRLGQGPLSPEQLPHGIEELVDDPFRSVAADVRREGGYGKSMDHFSEFAWAEYFRKRIFIGDGEAAYQMAVRVGVEFAALPEARGLPGFIESKVTCPSLLKASRGSR